MQTSFRPARRGYQSSREGAARGAAVVRTAGFLVLLATAVAIRPLAASADAVSDQKKAYKALGIGIPKPPALCSLLSTAEVESVIGKRVGVGKSAGPLSGCAWRAADGSNDGLLVTRGTRGDWYPATHTPEYTKVAGIGEQAYTAYEEGVGFEAGALAATGVTIVQLSGKGTAAAALKALRIAIKR